MKENKELAEKTSILLTESEEYKALEERIKRLEINNRDLQEKLCYMQHNLAFLGDKIDYLRGWRKSDE